MNQVGEANPRDQMIRQQIMERGIQDPRVIEAIRAIPRENFFPAEARNSAYADRAAPIGHGQTISQPYIVALMTTRLDVHSEQKVLEIGTGSGYQTAILSKLAKEVYTVERVKPLLDGAFERLLSLDIRNVHFHFGDGTLGWAEHAPVPDRDCQSPPARWWFRQLFSAINSPTAASSRSCRSGRMMSRCSLKSVGLAMNFGVQTSAPAGL